MKGIACLLSVFGLLLLSCNRPPEQEAQIASEEYHATELELHVHELGELKRRLVRLQQNHSIPVRSDSLLDLEFTGSAAHGNLLDDDSYMENLEKLLGEYRYREAQMVEALRGEKHATQKERQRVEWWKRELKTAQRDMDRLVHHLEELEKEVCARDAEIAKLENELNQVYFAFGSARELEDNGVASTRKSIFGKPRTLALKPDFNKAYFSAVDRRTIQEIPLLSKRAQLLSHHPSDSFRLRGEDGVEAIEIIDSERFWQHSNYLAVWVE